MTRARIDRLFAFLREGSSRVALEFGGWSFGYGELDRLSRCYARGLAALGVRRGDRVAVFAESSPEVVIALLGNYRAGAIHVPINTRYRAEEAGHILRDSGARAVLCARGSEQEAVLDAIGAVPGLERRIVIGGESEGDAVGWDALLAGGEETGDLVPEDEDTAVIVYTSGTTGKSKGVALSFRALVDNTLALTSEWRFSAEDRLALALPLFHVHGLCIGIHGALLHGMTVLLTARFEAGATVRAFEESGATVFMGVPTMYVRLLDLLAARPEAGRILARARLFTSGSAALPAADFDAFERATGHRILERYGMTETLFTLTNPYDGGRRPGTVGLPVDGCQVRIVDESGRLTAEGEPGEILVKSNGMMSEYWGRPEETRAAFRDGWFATGDVGTRDAAGSVRILGRSSVDVIKSGGFKISAREIEDVVATHPDIREVAVVGAPDRVWGERIVAAVVLRGAKDADAIAGEVLALCAQSLADYKRPKEIRILDELPRNALGKVQKHRILEEL
jgi:acyl-CoA synthetase (AMP-forming)/AMP-acid ligase II